MNKLKIGDIVIVNREVHVLPKEFHDEIGKVIIPDKQYVDSSCVYRILFNNNIAGSSGLLSNCFNFHEDYLSLLKTNGARKKYK